MNSCKHLIFVCLSMLFYFGCINDVIKEKSIDINESQVLQSVLKEIMFIDYQRILTAHGDTSYYKPNVMAFCDTSISGTSWHGKESENLLFGIRRGYMSEHTLRDIACFIKEDSLLTNESASVFCEFKSKLLLPIKFNLVNSDSLICIPFVDIYYGNNRNLKEMKLKQDSLLKKYSIKDVYFFSRIAFNNQRNIGILYYEFNGEGIQVIIHWSQNKWKVKKRRQIWIT